MMAYMAGLGLGGPVDIPEALTWMARSLPRAVDERQGVGELAYYLGHAAAKGNFGPDRVTLGRVWLQIAESSGSAMAKRFLEDDGKEVTLDRLMAGQLGHESTGQN